MRCSGRDLLHARVAANEDVELGRGYFWRRPVKVTRGANNSAIDLTIMVHLSYRIAPRKIEGNHANNCPCGGDCNSTGLAHSSSSLSTRLILVLTG